LNCGEAHHTQLSLHIVTARGIDKISFRILRQI
jgi:hypothetical protein